MSGDGMRALTVKQPWAWALAQGHKPVENRSWKLPTPLLGRWVLVHAGLSVERDAFPRAAAWADVEPEAVGIYAQGGIVTGAIIGAVRFIGVVKAGAQAYPDVTPMAVETLSHAPGLGAAVDTWRAESRHCPWWAGPLGWVVGESVVIEPIDAKGKLGLWRVSEDIERLARERIDYAQEAAQ